MGVHCYLVPIPERRLMNLEEAHVATFFEAAHAYCWHRTGDLWAIDRMCGLGDPLPPLFLEKRWWDLHIYLNETDATDPMRVDPAAPRSWAILGGTPIGPELQAGPGRYLWADEVRAVAAALAAQDRGALRRRLLDSPGRIRALHDDALWAAGLEYAHDDDILTVVEDFDRDAADLASYYRTLAAHGSALLLGLNCPRAGWQLRGGVSWVRSDRPVCYSGGLCPAILRGTARIMHPLARRLAPACLLALTCPLAHGQDAPPPAPELPAAQAQVLDRISADSLRGHLSFLASDLLEGRDTPSKGLDLAAEYIAAQFRRAGLEPVGDDGYFQTAKWELAEPDAASFQMSVATAPDAVFRVPVAAVSLTRAGGIDVPASGVFKGDYRAAEVPAGVAGRVVLVEGPDPRRGDAASRRPASMALNAYRSKLTTAKAAWLVVVSREADAATGLGAGRLIDPINPEASERAAAPGGPNASVVGAITVHDPRLMKLFDALPSGPSDATTVAIHLGEPVNRPVRLRNVVGLLRGTDPALNQSVVMVTAHYDHIGTRGPSGAPDRIYNGANDDGSGTVSVIELASALGTLKPEDRPKRSVLFATFFGEEHGLLGSRYYGRHPIVPINQTVADLNLEQVGRTDSTEGPQVGTASLTGFGFSDVSTALAAAGTREGIKVYRHPQNSDAFFGRSDNQALADLGVPAHTLCVAFEYADYHGLADHWDKVDYANMARVDRAVARALLTIANDRAEPRWDPANPKATKYRQAWEGRHPHAEPAKP